jgi:aldehyde:ferredoxin oxidoreductase
MFGYRGKLLDVVLDPWGSGEIPLDLKMAREFLGGAGLGARLLWDWIQMDTDPLGPENPLMFLTGPFCGTMIPTGSKASAVARSPLTGFLGYSTFGGHFAADIKFAGYDGIIVRGAAKRPSYLFVDDSKVELRDAEHLWGKDTEHTWEVLKEESGYRNPGVARIGIAGENKVKYASIIIDHHRAAGRTGLGAVMGSKNLKGIVVHGSDRKIPVTEPEKVQQRVKELNEDRLEDATVRMYSDLGTAGYVDMASLMYGSMPAGYHTVGDFDSYNLSGTSVRETILVGKKACFRCPIGCGRVIDVKEGKYATGKFKGPEYEVTGTSGSLLLVSDIEALAFATMHYDLLGVDTINGGNAIAMMYYLFKEGKVTKEDLDGIEPQFGELDSALKLLQKIAAREGIGDLLAEGSRAVEEQFNVPGTAAQVHGMDVAMHDARGFSGMATAYTTSPRGACHMSADMYNIQMGVQDEGWNIESEDRFANEADLVARVQDFRCVTNAVLVCHFYPFMGDEIAELLNLVTGWDYSLEELKATGERIFTMQRLLNLRLGYKTANEKLPEILLQPLEGATEGHVPDVDSQLDKWYAYRGWDRKTGQPPWEKVEKLGLGDLTL